MVALYGHPGSAELGALGEQPLDEAVTRTQQAAEAYQDLVDEPVVPVFELITTVAASEPGPNGDYSEMTPVQTLRPWVTAAGEAGIYVLLDLQPGRTDFLTQAELTKEHRLPQKLLVLHQFRLSMITDREQLVTDHDELSVLIHADGHGTAEDKLATWDALRADAGPQLWWGWKNFYDEDQPMFTPEQTVEVEPAPWFVSYQ